MLGIHFPYIWCNMHIFNTYGCQKQTLLADRLWNTLNWSVVHQLRPSYCLGTKNNSRLLFEMAHIWLKIMSSGTNVKRSLNPIVSSTLNYSCKNILLNTMERGRIKTRADLMGYFILFVERTVILLPIKITAKFHSERNILNFLAQLDSYK